MIPQLTIPQRLRIARENAGFDRAADRFAKVVGLSRQTVSNYERGATVPERKSLMAWSAATNVPVWWLEGYDSPTSPLEGTDVTIRFARKSGNVIDIASKRQAIRKYGEHRSGDAAA